MPEIAIIGSGPTAIYCLKHLLTASRPLNITVFEAQSEAGTGSPYRPALNDKAMLSNIASLEIPPIVETLVEWLTRQTDAELERMEIDRSEIDERAFFPRLVLGEFFRDQFNLLLEQAGRDGHVIVVHTETRVLDIVLQPEDIRLEIEAAGLGTRHADFHSVVMATGHRWPDETQPKPGYFTSPWPASALHEIGNCAVGIRGTSLSAIDALVAVASAHGTFVEKGDALDYRPHPGTDAFTITMMSRKGLLPEADFYHPVPYLPLQYLTAEAAKEMVESGENGLLEATFALFKKELAASDPGYAAKIGLGDLTVETFGRAYFAERHDHDPFEWAAQNLREAKTNKLAEVTVPWRYAILRMHEVVALVVPYFAADELERFHKHFKPVFADDYATVPHTSIERILAMRKAGKLDILKLGDDYEVDTKGKEPGVLLTSNGETRHFPAFIEARGQDTLSAPDLPFPSLHRRGGVTAATAPVSADADQKEEDVEVKGLALDTKFRPILSAPSCNRLYCLSLPFLLYQFPFVQGITSSSDLAEIVADEIGRDFGAVDILTEGPELASGAPKPLELA